ncbi:MAG: alkaline phosphatase PhoX [Pseudomonadota bacterium]
MKTLMTVLLTGTALAGATPVLAQEVTPGLKRFATVPLGAEFTGLYITDAGDLFYNAQHPADSNAEPNNLAAVGVLTGVDMTNLPTDFESVKVPETDEEKQGFLTAVGTYQPLFREGDFADTVAGGVGALMAADGSKIKQSNDPDFNAFIPTNDGSTEGYIFTNWEDRPGGMSRIKLAKGDDGSWSVDNGDAMMVDFRPVNGTWINCFGSVSPWGTPLTSEELYFDDTSQWNNASFEDYDDQVAVERYLGNYPNPYDYGYIVEIADPTGAAEPVKHFAMGRYSHENSVVMPDEKTVYLSDDGTGTVMFKFIADTAGDLTAGTLYAAKATQDEGTDPATTGFDIEWIELAHGDNATIEGWIREYDGITPDDYTDGQTNFVSDNDIAQWAHGQGKDDRAAFLETRKAAAAKGATAEFRKMEGVMINHAGAADGSVPHMYMAMSEVGATMADAEGDIQLDENICGVVYGFELADDYDVTRMEPVIAGFGYNPDAAINQCDVGGISNPDNLLVLNDGRVLIGEDTGLHENNMLWVYDPTASAS